MATVNNDVFSCVLSHVSTTSTIYTILRAIPLSNVLFSVALTRLFQLPIHLSCMEGSDEATHKILDYLLGSTSEASALVESLKHVVLFFGASIEPPDTVKNRLHKRLPGFFLRTQSLQTLDWWAPTPSTEDLEALQRLKRLRTLRINCTATTDSIHGLFPDRSSLNPVPLMVAFGPNLTSLELHHFDELPLLESLSCVQEHSSFKFLKHLYIDLSGNVWDRGQIPALSEGPPERSLFRYLGFSALTEFKMRASDPALSGNGYGPMKLVQWEILEELSLEVVHSFIWMYSPTIQLFNVLPPEKFSALTTLEIKDEKDADRKIGRYYRGLVPHFLASITSGHLSNLVNLWVNENVLCMLAPYIPGIGGWGPDEIFYSVKHLFNEGVGDGEERLQKRKWMQTLKEVFSRMESLRVGLGTIDDVEAGLILDCCDPAKLRQFGFQWNWRAYEHDDPISPALLKHLSRFPKLTDVHILLPRPGTAAVYRSLDPTINGRTLEDISLIFAANPSLCRVGISPNTVWGRHISPPSVRREAKRTEVTLIRNGLIDWRFLDPSNVPKFYNSGAVMCILQQTGGPLPQECVTPEVKEFAALLERILPPRDKFRRVLQV